MTDFGVCSSCRTALLQPHGFHSTDLCGPCCTGEASTLGLVTVQCARFGCNAVRELAPQPRFAANNWTEACAKHRPAGFR